MSRSSSSEHVVLVTIDDPFQSLVDEKSIDDLARAALSAETETGAEVHIFITDDAQVRELNRRYAGEDETTDVLSFSMREGEEFVSQNSVPRLGEVIISYPTAERQAREAGHLAENEVAHLLVHGILHLLGYDHLEPEDELRMRVREEEILSFSH